MFRQARASVLVAAFLAAGLIASRPAAGQG